MDDDEMIGAMAYGTKDKIIMMMRETFERKMKELERRIDNEVTQRREEDEEHIKVVKEILLEVYMMEHDTRAFIEHAATRGIAGVWAGFLLGAYQAGRDPEARARGDYVFRRAMDETNFDRKKAIADEVRKFSAFTASELNVSPDELDGDMAPRQKKAEEEKKYEPRMHQ